MLSLDLIQEARGFLSPRIRRTPMEFSPMLSQKLGNPVYFKLENLQITGSFKIRGAWFKLSRLTDAERSRGVITASAGNHGKGVAFAAKELGIRARIYVPSNVDATKYQGMVALGAEVIRSQSSSYDETEAWAKSEAGRLGMCFVSAFEDDAIMAGNGGTLGAEILEDLPDAANLIFPTSGGGMAAGISLYTRSRGARSRLIAVQHENSPALRLSMERGEAVTQMPGIDTLAGGIEGGVGAQNFELLRPRLDEVALVSEKEIRDAVVWMLENHQYLIEPTAAVALAAILFSKCTIISGPVAVVLSGRNVSLATLRSLLSVTGRRSVSTL